MRKILQKMRIGTAVGILALLLIQGAILRADAAAAGQKVVSVEVTELVTTEQEEVPLANVQIVTEENHCEVHFILFGVAAILGIYFIIDIQRRRIANKKLRRELDTELGVKKLLK